MKALSIKQPWASLICTPREYSPKLGIKDIENRTWKTKFRGKIYVHASGTKVLNCLRVLNEEQYLIAQKTFLQNGLNKFSDLSVSAIIGEIEIVDCVINHESIWAEKTDLYKANSRDYPEKIIYNWVLANPVLYEKPVPCKGRLSFWEPDFDIEECIWCSGKFDFEIMATDGTENYCPECWKEAEPILQAEYDELKGNGEID